MQTTSKTILIATILLALGCSPDVQTHDLPREQISSTRNVVTLATLPNGTFLENIAPFKQSQFLVTSYFDRKILRIDEQGQVSTFTVLEDYPVGIIVADERVYVSVHGSPFTSGPKTIQRNAITMLSFDGDVLQKQVSAAARFLNGLSSLPDGTILTADSLAGCLWSVDKETGELSLYASDPALKPHPSDTTFVPGANGIKVYGNTLFVSNSSRGEIIKRPLDSTVPFTRHALTGPIDDFVIDTEGVIYATSHGDRLHRISSTGHVTAHIDTGCNGCTAVAFSTDRRRLIVINQGNMFSDAAIAAQVLSISL
ncbi:MAG: SMP-30/gluconolactonase/LRE family protein [Pseudomonadota bacterium]